MIYSGSSIFCFYLIRIAFATIYQYLRRAMGDGGPHHPKKVWFGRYGNYYGTFYKQCKEQYINSYTHYTMCTLQVCTNSRFLRTCTICHWRNIEECALFRLMTMLMVCEIQLNQHKCLLPGPLHSSRSILGVCSTCLRSGRTSPRPHNLCQHLPNQC